MSEVTDVMTNITVFCQQTNVTFLKDYRVIVKVLRKEKRYSAKN